MEPLRPEGDRHLRFSDWLRTGDAQANLPRNNRQHASEEALDAMLAIGAGQDPNRFSSE